MQGTIHRTGRAIEINTFAFIFLFYIHLPQRRRFWFVKIDECVGRSVSKALGTNNRMTNEHKCNPPSVGAAAGDIELQLN